MVVAAGRQTRTPTPRILGRAEVRRTLRASAGTHDSGAKLTYAWLHDGKVIKGAKGTKLKISKKYAGQRITLRVTSTKTGYATVIKVSGRTKKVKR